MQNVKKMNSGQQNFSKAIELVDLSKVDDSAFVRKYVGSLILTKDNKILLQQRGKEWKSFPGCLSTFGGCIEDNESPVQALILELKEELGALVIENQVVNLGAITESATNYTELVYVFFWHDTNGTITGCYEGEALTFDNINDVLAWPKVMDDVRWLLKFCSDRGILS